MNERIVVNPDQLERVLKAYPENELAKASGCRTRQTQV